jgi:hypothetical protein
MSAELEGRLVGARAWHSGSVAVGSRSNRCPGLLMFPAAADAQPVWHRHGCVLTVQG